jgi:hypothetical protein
MEDSGVLDNPMLFFGPMCLLFFVGWLVMRSNTRPRPDPQVILTEGAQAPEEMS